MAPGTELVDLVDARDRKVGVAPLAKCLREGLLHRAVAVLVFRPGGALLVQRRSLNDLWHPGRLTLSCTGHVKAGETYLAAARRELAEELGLSGKLRSVDKTLLPRIRSKGLTELEMVAVFSCTSSAPVTIDRNELDSVRLVPRRRLSNLLKGRALTPDARILLCRFLESIGHDSGSGDAFQYVGGPLQR